MNNRISYVVRGLSGVLVAAFGLSVEKITPVVFPECGHSFCRLCALDSMSKSDRCALCRCVAKGKPMPNYQLNAICLAVLKQLNTESQMEYERRALDSIKSNFNEDG